MGETNRAMAQAAANTRTNSGMGSFRAKTKKISIEDARAQWHMRDRHAKPYTGMNGAFTFKSKHGWSVQVWEKEGYAYITYEKITFMSPDREEVPF